MNRDPDNQDCTRDPIYSLQSGMSDEELLDAVSGLFAYDTGAASSGIRDELLRQKVIEELHKGLGTHQLYSVRAARIARELFLTDEAIAQGYGLADVAEFIEWLDGPMCPERQD